MGRRSGGEVIPLAFSSDFFILVECTWAGIDAGHEFAGLCLATVMLASFTGEVRFVNEKTGEKVFKNVLTGEKTNRTMPTDYHTSISNVMNQRRLNWLAGQRGGANLYGAQASGVRPPGM
ncbi:unnamed protein product [Prorocentrum cordatum]|uniref:Uncharacterized protein n=1 Tax=Prorocentrum cordatum TaxID=2364126 RepID=A0ABN9PAM4_9DINO|nr:unnamed protein product [Polarella glacialis]